MRTLAILLTLSTPASAYSWRDAPRSVNVEDRRGESASLVRSKAYGWGYEAGLWLRSLQPSRGR